MIKIKPYKLLQLFVLLSMTITFFSTSFHTMAQSSQSDKYLWEFYSSNNANASASDLAAKLESEVQKVVTAGHLRPLGVIYGEDPMHYYYYHRYDTIYTLSLAYPYLSSTLQNSVKTYLKNEMQTYPLWDATLLPVLTGTKRDMTNLPDNLYQPMMQEYNNRPSLFSLYALWLYANNTGDWTYLDTNWNSIKTFYTNKKAEINSQYSSIAGAIGMVRMSQQKPTKDPATQASVTTDINNGLNAGKNFLTFSQNAEAAYKWNANGWDGWTKYEIFLGFQFLDITPEIGRYFYDDSTGNFTTMGLREHVLGNPAFDYSSSRGSTSISSFTEDYYNLHRGEFYFPIWYVAHAPEWSRTFGEGSGTPPDARAMIFPLEAWVKKQPAATLRTYLDVPIVPVGDYYYMQNLTRTLQASGQECWNNILTSQPTCGTSPSTTVSPPITTTAIPCTLKSKGDADCDGKISLTDYEIWRKESTGIFSTKSADFNSDNSVNAADYLLWKANLK